VLQYFIGLLNLYQSFRCKTQISMSLTRACYSCLIVRPCNRINRHKQSCLLARAFDLSWELKNREEYYPIGCTSRVSVKVIRPLKLGKASLISYSNNKRLIFTTMKLNSDFLDIPSKVFPRQVIVKDEVGIWRKTKGYRVSEEGNILALNSLAEACYFKEWKEV
jgi:hypothetical protein